MHNHSHDGEIVTEEQEQLNLRQGKVLRLALVLNFIMFFVEFIAGLMSNSNALLADSLDMLGDSAIYGFSILVLHRGKIWKSRVALGKGVLMAIMGLAVIANSISKYVGGVMPVGETMSAVAVLAMIANGITLAALYKYRADDLNIRSTWLCTRNDVISNVGVLLAGALVVYSNSIIPDLVVALAISTIVLKSAYETIRDSSLELRRLR